MLTIGALVSSAQALELKPFKDRLFAYPELLRQDLAGAYRVVDYRELRDINGRDEIPERRVKQPYVALSVRRHEGRADDPFTHRFAGNRDGASVITVYLHGQGGSSKQGMNDFTFGGNFNRIKNLMVRNDGLYLSPDFPDFGQGGEDTVAAIIGHYAARSLNAPVIVACGSAGGALCWRLADNPAVVKHLAGLMLLGSTREPGFLNSKAFAMRVPVFFGHGGRDTVFAVERQEAFFHDIRKASPGYPVRFMRFESGTHGTPIRMTDWRETINWMLSVR